VRSGVAKLAVGFGFFERVQLLTFCSWGGSGER
jgi:hypothetical protein